MAHTNHPTIIVHVRFLRHAYLLHVLKVKAESVLCLAYH